jgi:hypothetical protein
MARIFSSYPYHLRYPRLEILSFSDAFRKWDREIPATGWRRAALVRPVLRKSLCDSLK